VDHYSGRSTVDSRPGQGGVLADAWHAAATEGGSSPQEHLEKEGAEGNLTVGEGSSTGAERGRRRWTKMAAGWSSVWGEWRHGEAKQRVGRGAVGCCSARGSFYRPSGGAEGSGGGWPVMEFNFTGFSNEMGRGVDEMPS
jgi:hypothetical protein